MLPLHGTTDTTSEPAQCQRSGLVEVGAFSDSNRGRKVALRQGDATLVDSAAGSIEIFEAQRDVPYALGKSIERKAQASSGVLFYVFGPSGSLPTDVDVHATSTLELAMLFLHLTPRGTGAAVR